MRTKTHGHRLFPLLLVAGICLLLPLLAFAAEGSEDRWGIWFGAGRFFNLALVAAVLVWAAKKPLASFFENRSQSIREQLEEAQRAREAAEAKLAEIETRMSGLDGEIQALRAEAEKQAQEDQRRILEEAERDAQKVLDRARQEIAGMTRAAQIELKKHAAELAVRLAEESIRRGIDDEDRKRLFAGFITRMGARE